MYKAIDKYGMVRFMGYKKECWIFCEKHDFYGTWKIVKAD